ncbi:MAG: hypothetical protein WBG16_06165, partial [Bradyrhizobium sp.]|uniref:hypothetical protein n=1 Tax=Bradyrhizobium sp. TaxID=376 RepID=UPI003C77F380
QTAPSETDLETVIAGLDPAIHLLRETLYEDGWMPGSSPGMTNFFPRRISPELFTSRVPLKRRGRRESRMLQRTRSLASEK